MKRRKICHRTLGNSTMEPYECIGEGCSMHGNAGGIQGCLETTACFLNCLNCMNAMKDIKTEPTPKTEEIPEIKEETIDESEVTEDESETDSRAGNILEGGTEPPVPDDTDSSIGSS